MCDFLRSDKLLVFLTVVIAALWVIEDISRSARDLSKALAIVIAVLVLYRVAARQGWIR